MKEYILISTTFDNKEEANKVIDNLLQNSYDTPQIVAYDIVDGYSKYLNWIEEETNG